MYFYNAGCVWHTAVADLDSKYTYTYIYTYLQICVRVHIQTCTHIRKHISIVHINNACRSKATLIYLLLNYLSLPCTQG